MRILVTGGSGFIGSHFIRLLLGGGADDRVTNLDKLTYAGNPENLRDVEDDPRYRFLRGDIADPAAVREAMEGVDAVVNFAAETHVDRSIHSADDFIRTDILGVHTLLEEARRRKVPRFVHISTDEVYGSIAQGAFTEESPLSPSSPYSASKAGGDLLALAYHRTHGLPVVITRSSNNYGPNQYPEKVIPLFITNLIEGRRVPLYGDGLNVRDWLHVEDNCRAILLVLREGREGEVYNIGAGQELTNLELTRTLVRLLDRDESFIQRVEDRPAHDRRYSVDSRKVRALGWSPRIGTAQGLAATVRWYQEHPGWWTRIKSGEYLEYYRRQYREQAGDGG
jgi:dTDP-glucose 4,6-dehydratase